MFGGRKGASGDGGGREGAGGGWVEALGLQNLLSQVSLVG